MWKTHLSLCTCAHVTNATNITFADDSLKISANGKRGLKFGDHKTEAPKPPVDNHGDCHRSEEQVNVHLESADPEELEPLERQFLRLSSLATITTLKKYIAHHVFKDLGKFSEVCCRAETCSAMALP